MALTGSLVADFSSFQTAVDESVVKLRAFEQGSAKVETSLNRMAESFSGRKIISDATLMAEVFQRAGGAATFTGAELSRMGAVGSEALEKLRVTGQPIPVDLQKMVDATQRLSPSLETMHTTTTGASNALGTFRTGLSEADKTLASMGVHIGPEIHALDELAASAGKTAAQVGLIGTVGLSVAASLAGWKLGRMVAEFFDLDEAIGTATAKLLGFGDVAAQEAGAGMDVLMRATQLAGREITNFAEAQQIVIDANLKFQSSMNDSEFRVRQWRVELAAVAEKGSLNRLRGDMEAHNSTLKELSTQYGISERALAFYQRQLDATAEAQKKDAAIAAAATDQMSAALGRLAFLGDGWKKTLEGIDPLTKTAIQNYLALGATQADLATKFGLTALQVKAVAQGMAEQTTIMGLTEPKLGSLTEFVKGAAKATDDWSLELGLTNESLKDIGATIDTVSTKVNAFNAGAAVSAPGQTAATIGGVSVSAGDTTNEERMMGWNAPGAIVDRTSEAYQRATQPRLFAGGGGSAVMVTNNITQPLGTPAEIARVVGDSIMAQLRASGVRLPSGA